MTDQTEEQPAAVSKRAPGGRPSKRTPRTAKRILKAVRLGLSLTHACRVAGISPSTFHAWKNSSAKFRDQIDTAIAERCEALLGIMTEAAKQDWRAAQALLQMTEGFEHYSKNRVEHQHVHFNADKVLIYLPEKQTHGKAIEGQ